MSLSTVLFLFLVHLGVGIIFTLVFVSREAGVKFFRFNAGLTAILFAVGFALRPAEPPDFYSRVALTALAVAELAMLVYWATVGRALASIRPAIVGVALAGGLITVVVQALAASTGRALAGQVMTIASFLSSAALLGGACTAMILGHWYLVIPSLQVSHLQSIVKMHMASMVVRVVVVGAVVFVAIRAGSPGWAEFREIHDVDRRDLLLAACALWSVRPGPAVVSHLGNREDTVDAIGHGHSVR